MTAKRVDVIELAGTSRQKGRTHGEVCAVRIKARLERIMRGRSRRLLENPRFSDHCDLISNAAPQLYEEIVGISEGAGITLREAVALCSFEALDHLCETGCTSLAVSSDQHVFVAQNWDAPDHSNDELQIFIHMDQGKETLVIAPVGGLCWVGMNGLGFALVNNDLVTRNVRPALPSQAIRRLILNCSDCDGARDVLVSKEHPSGRAYLLGDRSGRLLCAEVAADTAPQLLRSRRLLHHTNHAQSGPVRTHELNESLEQIYPTSHTRAERVLDLLTDHTPASVTEVVAYLSDHQNHPNSICKHPSFIEPSHTALSVVFDLVQCSAHVCLGNPCTNSFQRFKLPRRQ